MSETGKSGDRYTEDERRIAEAAVEVYRTMARLRDPGRGCPWDLEQTHLSLKPYLVEETYEVAEAIDRHSRENSSESGAVLAEELGDLLLQILFHSRLAEEDGFFDFSDVMSTLAKKLKKRHPHIFEGANGVKNARDVAARWEEIKRMDKGGDSSILEGVPPSLPALLQAYRVQEKVSNVGFDWKDARQSLPKIKEEMEELLEVMESARGGTEELEEELGDVLFSLVNTARLMGLNPEFCLKRTIDKFSRRFARLERLASQRGLRLGEAGLERLDALWEEVKSEEGR